VRADAAGVTFTGEPAAFKELAASASSSRRQRHGRFVRTAAERARDGWVADGEFAVGVAVSYVS